MNVKYSKNFDRDYNWYLSVSDIFSFDGTKDYYNKKGIELIQFDKNGKTAKECFYLYDTNGVIKPTCEPDKLKTLLKTKGSINLHIKMYAQDRANCSLPGIEFQQMCKEWGAPEWCVKAVETQKMKHWPI